MLYCLALLPLYKIAIVFYAAYLRPGRLNQIHPTAPYLDVFFLFLNPVEGTQTLLGLAYSIKSMKKGDVQWLNRPGPKIYLGNTINSKIAECFFIY